MKAPAALDLVASWLAEMRISPTHTRVLLGLLYMAHDAAAIFESELEQDRCMRREAEHSNPTPTCTPNPTPPSPTPSP